MNPIHWAFDKLYPAIRFLYERVQGHAWFDQITSQIWMGGAPTYPRDYDYLLVTGINAVVDVREEREGDLELYAVNQIDYLKLKVLDVMVPSDEQLDAGTVFIDEHVKKGGKVLIHCAKGRGRSATMLAAYLMRYEGLSYDEARALMLSKRSLVNLQGRHQKALERWVQKYQVQQNSMFIEP
jgi:atypical dual specificity phosphatase